jgi:hypothetical protein
VSFTIVDKKTDCLSIYTNGNFYFGSCEFPNSLDSTWSYHPYFEDRVNYAHLFCLGQKLTEICPEDLKIRWEVAKSKYKAFLNSLKSAKVAKTNGCIYELVPSNILSNYCEVKNEIIEHVINHYNKPLIYETLVAASAIAFAVGQQNINLDYPGLSKAAIEDQTLRDYLVSLKEYDPIIEYDIFGTITGRFTTRKNSFPILTLAKKHRSILLPNNDYFVELDYNSAEARTAYYLTNKQQAAEDLHQWNIDHIFKKQMTREEAKKLLFSYLYGYSENSELDKVYNKKEIIKSWDGQQITNHFGRSIRVADPRLAVNYVVQSTSSDLFIRQANKVLEFLKGKKSCIAFTIHDSLIIDLAKEDKIHLTEIINLFSETEFGRYKINVSVGKNFGRMQRTGY